MKKTPGIRWIEVVIMLCLLGCGTGKTVAHEPIKEEAATPTIGERLTQDVVRGTLMSIDREHYSIVNNDGNTVRVHVDKSTKLDKVAEGDLVRAYVTEHLHVTTLQRVKN